MDDLQRELTEARKRHAHYVRLLEERSAAAEEARAPLAQETTYPKRRAEVESELFAAETDLKWIRPDLAELASRIRLLEAELALMMAADVEQRIAEAARTAKVAKGKAVITPPRKTEALSDN